MEKKRLNYANLKRLAPGPFTEKVLDALEKGIDFERFKIQLLAVELGDDPFTEKINVTFYVVTPEGQNRRKGQPPGPKLFFTFSNEDTLNGNLQELREFVLDHAQTAESAPTVVRQAGGQLGD